MMMKQEFKILALNNVALQGQGQLPAERYEIASEIADPDAVLLRSQDIHEMEISKSLLAVARAGAGVNNVPVEKLTTLGIPVFNAPGANANAVKELVLTGLFLAARSVIPAWDYVRRLEGSEKELAEAVESGKRRFVGFELPGKTLGIVGLGAIGVEVANAALELGMNVVGYDPKITVDRAWQLSAGVEQAPSMNDVFNRANIVTVHVPLNDDTRGLIGQSQLSIMPKGAVALNFARHGIYENKAVLQSLAGGPLSGYVTDFPTRDLIGKKGVICLPHLGASTLEAEENCAVMVTNNLQDFLENGNIRHSVNFPDALLRRTRPHRIAIANTNVPNMVGQVSTCLAQEDINIADLLNVSKGAVAHTIVDLDGPVGAETLKRILSINGILCARVLPIFES